MNVVGALFAAALGVGTLSGCSSAAPCCGPARTGCREVWVPPRCETCVQYCVEPAKTHTRPLPVMGLCREVHRECVDNVRTEPRVVPDQCIRRVPVEEPDCLPVTGYHRVQDCRDIMVPVCGERCVELTEEVEVPDYGWVTDRCGCRQMVQTGCHKETRSCGQRRECHKVGERLMSVKAGSHLEQCQTGQRVACVPVGEREAAFQTGTHIEQVPVWRDSTCVETGSEIHAVQTGTRCDTYETMPWRYRAQEHPVEVPGFCATICSDPRHHHHRGIVLTEAEYQEYLLAARN